MMDVRFYETGLRQVASGLVNLSHPTPQAIDHLANELHTVAVISAEAGRGEISGLAQKAQAAAQALAAAESGARSICIEAVGNLGQRLLADLCAEAERSTPAATAIELKRRVLVVDDSRVATTALCNTFRAQHFEVRTAVTLEDAFLELVLFAPTVLVSDVFMPNLEVELLARVFRSLSRGRPNLLVLVSGSSGEALHSRLKNVEPDVFISKMEGSAKVVERVLSIWDKESPLYGE
jgi:PleD family two-component response regulator